MAEGIGRLSTESGIKLLTNSPAERQAFSRAFYQLEERFLIVAIYPAGRFYSYLDSSQLHLDVDSSGRLLSLQVLVPRKDWIIIKGLVPPAPQESADIRFVDFREKLPEAAIETTPRNDLLHLSFLKKGSFETYRLAEELLVDITPNATLAGFWLLKIYDDRASVKLAAWRRELENSLTE